MIMMMIIIKHKKKMV